MKVKEVDKYKKNKLMLFHIVDGKLLGKFKAIWNKIEDLKNIKLNALTVYAGRYINPKIRTYGDKVLTNFCGLNVPESNEPFTAMFI